MVDLQVQNHGSIFILQAISNEGKQWVAEHIPADAQTWGVDGIVVEHRYIEAIVAGAINDGLEVL